MVFTKGFFYYKILIMTCLKFVKWLIIMTCPKLALLNKAIHDAF